MTRTTNPVVVRAAAPVMAGLDPAISFGCFLNGTTPFAKWGQVEMAGSSPTRCTHLVPQPDAKVAAGRPQSRIRVKLRAIGSIGRGSLHDTTSKTYACNQLKRRAIFRCVNLVGLDPAIGYPHQIANDAIPVSNHPMEMAGSSVDVVGPLRA